MATWWVSEPQINLRLEDEPLWYNPAIGPQISFKLSYQSSGALDTDPYVFGVGPNWSCSFRQFILAPNGTGGDAYLHRGGVGFIDYLFTGAQQYDGSLIAAVSDGYAIESADGTIAHFATPCTNSAGDVYLFLTSLTDPSGNSINYAYTTNSGIFQLAAITDALGNVTHIYYDNPTFPNQITSVVDPFARTNTLVYDSSGYLINSVDVAGLLSAFGYDTGAQRSNITNLATPYGNTGFLYGQIADSEPYLQITVPTGGRYLYLYETNCSFLSTFSPTPPSTVPYANTFENYDGQGEFSQFNSFFWGPLQYAALSTTDPTALTTSDFHKGRMRHWLQSAGDFYALSLEQAPSPDGTTAGQITWYDYEGKYTGGGDNTGNSAFPSFVAQVLPDGSTHFDCSLRGEHLNVVTNLSSYSGASGSVAVRTSSYIYAPNAIDLLRWIGPNGEQVVSNYFSPGNTIHQPDASFDALNQETTYTYNSYGQLTSVNTPAGLTTTNYYFTSGASASRLSSTIDLPILRTNAYTYYNNGLVATLTDPRGLATTYAWDNLQRLTGVTYPDGTTSSNLYTFLDVTGTKDRLGNWTHYGYNAIRQRVAETNANRAVTAYSYCDCGLLYAVTNGWSTPAQIVTSYGYDLQGHRQFIYLPDATITNWYDSVGHLTTTCDAWGCRGYEYNNQGLLTATYDSCGYEASTIYDNEDRPLFVTDANQVTITNTYDLLGRLLARGHPDGGVERFGYTARGLAAYTNQLNFTNFYYYDAALRKTSDVNADGQTLLYTNNPAGDLLSLTDGKNQTTRWNYDAFGRVTNKLDQSGAAILKYQYDPDNRLTNRWSAAVGNTRYRYDAVGNVTNIAYPNDGSVSYAYDPLNRLINMLDAVGTTVYTYASGGERFTEDGPFASDTVTNVYLYRQRVGLGLQQPTGRWTNSFGYDTAKRLTSVGSPAGAFGYTYDTQQLGLVDKVTLPTGSIITNRYDGSARLLGTWLKTSGSTVLDAATYGYNALFQRTTVTNAAGTNVAYQYDPLGQLTVATSSTALENRGYSYDAAWNLNQVTNHSGTISLLVDGLNQMITNGASVFTYDANGNLTSQADHGNTVTYGYDDENRLARILSPSGNNQTTFVYDGLGRLREQLYWVASGGDGGTGGGSSSAALRRGLSLTSSSSGSWTLLSGLEYIYDGNRVIQERDTNNTPTVSYTRGKDLSGSLEGAGGIGGLLARSGNFYFGNFTNHNYYHADGNGNITYLETASQGLAASYRYDSYGNLLASSGTLAATNSYQFSSKESFTAYGRTLYYYLYRFYSPVWQRWMNRDPIEEWGGLNLYVFVGNDSINFIDLFGLDDVNLYEPGSTSAKAADCRGTKPNEITVGGHGTEEAAYDGRSGKLKPMSIDDLAKAITSAKEYDPKKPVCLYNCEAGKGDNSVAQRLSKVISNPITASSEKTSEKIWSDKDSGKVVKSDTPSPINGGKWRTFQGGKEIK